MDGGHGKVTVKVTVGGWQCIVFLFILFCFRSQRYGDSGRWGRLHSRRSRAGVRFERGRLFQRIGC